MTEPAVATELRRLTRVAAYALVIDDQNRILLVRISPAYPAAGHWTLPGGGIKFGEDPADAVLRELTEETGLEGERESLAFVSSRTGPADPTLGFDVWHGIRIVYRVRIVGGELRDETDESTDSAQWFPMHELDPLPKVELVRRALDHLGEK